MQFVVRRLQPVFVGEVSGVDVAQPLVSGTLCAIRDAIGRYAVLVLRVIRDNRCTMHRGRPFDESQPVICAG
jgi:hypothetical protein